MAKRKRTCKDCAVCEIKEGLTLCHFGGGEPSVVFADNTACKMCVGAQPKKADKPTQEPGSAPFCGDYAKCNDGEGCDSCREFELWMADQEKRRGKNAD